MEFKVDIEGVDKLLKASDRVKAELARELEKGLYASALRVEREAKISITNGGKTGRVYQRRTVSHQASAPGEPPASDTGRLVNSFASYVNKLSQEKIESFVVAGRGVVRYARMLEFGTTKMAPRPYMMPALEKSRSWIRDRVTMAIRDGIKKATRK